MTLVPMKGLLGGVAKREQEQGPQAAAMLVRLGLFEALTSQIDQVREPMTRVVLGNVEKRNAQARSVVLRKAAAGAQVPTEYATALEDVEKGLMAWALHQFNRDHPRDDRGRFVSRKLGRNINPNMAPADRTNQHTTEALQYVDRLKRAGMVNDKTKVTVGLSRVDDNGRPSDTIDRHTVPVSELGGFLVSHADQLPREVSVARRHLNTMSPAQLAAVDLTALATQQTMPNAKTMTEGLFQDGKVKQQGQQISEDWNRETKGTERQAYSRIKMTGQALSAVAAPGSTLSAVGGLAQLMGEMGPEAEKVLGPGIRRTAYRYRGTERRPERDLYTAVQRATVYADALNDPELHEEGREKILTTARTRGPGDTAAIVAANYMRPDMPEDQRDLFVRGGAAIASLLGIGRGKGASKLPDLKLTELSLASGEMPPSEGVIIDAHGRVVSQAVGYNGDHYLPFNLRNLNALHGGQYVRTRATGGPTTEDIYTALVTGARQIQVVSNSGVFTVEFDPDLRGARRFNDKVKRMVERYGSMLAAIHAPDSELYESDLSPAEESEIRERAARASSSREEYTTNLTRLREQARLKSETSSRTSEESERMAYERAATVVDQEQKQMRESLSPQARARRIEEVARETLANEDPGVRRLQLNGKGYERALRALKQEFPYYIRTATFETLPDWLARRQLPNDPQFRRNAPKEVGYVEPGQTNTARARRGGFRSARFVPTGSRRAEATEVAPRSEASTKATETAATERQGSAASATTTSAPDVKALIAGKIASAGTPLMRMVHSIPPIDLPDSNDSDDRVMEDYPPRVYLHRIASKTIAGANPGEEGKALAAWLANAKPRQRETLLEGIDQFAKHPDTAANGLDGDQIRAFGSRIRQYLDLAEPFAQPAEGVPAWATPPTAGKPVRLSDAPADLNADDEEWGRAAEKMGVEDTDLLDAIVTLQKRTPPERAKYVQDIYDDFEQARDRGVDTTEQEKDLEHAHRAWSFVHAHDTAQRMRKLLEGDAGPKAQPGQPGEARKSLEYDPPADEFLRELRSQIDVLLQD